MISSGDAGALFIGSFPFNDHILATNLILKHSPNFPCWPQLPIYPTERLLTQTGENIPGFKIENDSVILEIDPERFDNEVIELMSIYIDVLEKGKKLAGSRFAFTKETGRGFFSLIHALTKTEIDLKAIKGQVTGPFTMATSVKDRSAKLAVYYPQMWDIITKAITLKALYQVEEFQKIHEEVIIFLDEPGLAGFGSSSFISISREDVISALNEIIEILQNRNVTVGVHVCANTDWSLLIDTKVNILSFDSYEYFDKLLLYKKELVKFLERGGILAFGIVPTSNREAIKKETISSLYERFLSQIGEIGLPPRLIISQSFITPSCGMGLLTEEECMKVLSLTSGLSTLIREKHG